MKNRLIVKICIYIIHIYKVFISPISGKCCRFYPTCSDYTCEAIKCYGVIHGIYLGTKRILRCCAYCTGGIDLVPPPD